jgi:hypothetical protein
MMMVVYSIELKVELLILSVALQTIAGTAGTGATFNK